MVPDMFPPFLFVVFLFTVTFALLLVSKLSENFVDTQTSSISSSNFRTQVQDILKRPR